MNRLQDKVAVIFGGTGGIGGAIASGFVTEGAVVVPTSRTGEKVGQTVKNLSTQGNRYQEIITCDITHEDQIKSLCQQVKKLFGRIDIMVCASGAYLKKPCSEVSLQEWDTIIQTNLTGTFLANKVVGTIMLAQKKGSIINIGSLGSFVSLSHTLPYCVSKAGVVMLTKSLSSEWCKDGVRVNALIPGVFPTDLNRQALSDPVRLNNIVSRTPIGRLGDVRELAGAAVYLASDESNFVTGIALPVDGGFLAHSGF